MNFRAVSSWLRVGSECESAKSVGVSECSLSCMENFQNGTLLFQVGRV